MIRPQRRVTVLLAHLFFVSTCFQDLLRRTDMHVVPFPEAQKNAGVNSQAAEELDDGSGGVEIFRGHVLFEDIDDLQNG